MTMPPWSDDPEQSRPYFRRLRELAGQHGLHALSMGMSHDFEVAIEEGATLIRVGTALFGKRSTNVTVGFHSPLPPQRTGVADYSRAPCSAHCDASAMYAPVAADAPMCTSITPATMACIARSTGSPSGSPASWCCTMPC